MSEDWKAGDIAVKVGGPCTRMPKGTVTRVVGLCLPERHSNGELGLHLAGWSHATSRCKCWLATNFRKLRPSTESVEDMIRKHKPVKDREHA